MTFGYLDRRNDAKPDACVLKSRPIVALQHWKKGFFDEAAKFPRELEP